MVLAIGGHIGELFNLITGWVKNGHPERASLLKYVRSIIGLNPRNPNEMVLAIGGDIMIGGDSVEIGILTQPWRETKQKMPVKRAYHGIGLINKSVYVFGGCSHYNRPPSNATYICV